MAAPKRTEGQIIQDRELTSALYIRGVPYHKIAVQVVQELKREYTLTTQQIKYDVDIIRKDMFEYYKTQMQTLLAEQLGKIDSLEFEAWQAWEKSKGETHGNIDYFGKIQWCVETRLRLLGLLKPQSTPVPDDFGVTGNDQIESSGHVVYIPHNNRDNIPVKTIELNDETEADHN